jgi:hypothetical protein
MPVYRGDDVYIAEQEKALKDLAELTELRAVHERCGADALQMRSALSRVEFELAELKSAYQRLETSFIASQDAHSKAMHQAKTRESGKTCTFFAFELMTIIFDLRVCTLALISRETDSAELLAAKNQAESSRDQALAQLELLRVEYQDYRTETAGKLRSLAAENGKLASSMVENDVQVLRLMASLQTATTDTKLLRDQLANISYQLLVKEGELEAVQNDLAVAKMRVSNGSAPEKEAVAVSVRLDGHPSDFTDCKREQFLAEFARELVSLLLSTTLVNIAYICRACRWPT